MKPSETLYHSITNVDEKYIEEAQYAAASVSAAKTPNRPCLQCRRLASCVAAVLLIAVLSFGTVYATSKNFRQAVKAFFYPLYTSGEVQEIAEGHRTGSFDEVDTLLSFLNQFNRDDLGHGLQARQESGYSYSWLTTDEDSRLAAVACDLPDYTLLVTMEKIAYEDTTGLWQVTSYQVVSTEEAENMRTS